ncbi:MAG: hypothetical protein KC561_00785, partial [Myxococcales bacterium]|nr:hypothetical protein [Myxococcales bacterium]
LRRTVHDVRSGNSQARCRIEDAPHEVRQIGMDLNWLLDRSQLQTITENESPDAKRETEVRRVLAWVLDREDVPTAVFDERGNRVAANRTGLRLSAPKEQDGESSSEPVPGTELLVVRGKVGETNQAPTEGAAT